MDVSKDLARLPRQIEDRLPGNFSVIPWTRTVAAGSLVTSAVLLLSGKRRGALAVAVGAAAVALLENPDAARELWNNIPNYIRAGQDFFIKAESFIEQLSEQGEKLRGMVER